MRDHLFLLRELIRRDQQSRYAGSALGFLWSLAQPLWQLVLFTVVFSIIIRIPLDDEPSTNLFALFVFSGLIPWMAVNEGLTRSATAITDGADLVKKLRFPREILVVALVGSAFLQSLIAAGVFLVVLGFMGEASWSTVPWVAVPMVFQLALTLGLGLLLAALQVFFRDVVQLVTMVITGWFYLTPIVYPLGFVAQSERGAAVARWLELNPLTPIVGWYRGALLGGPFDWPRGGWSLVVTTLLALALGWALFRRLAPTFPDEV